MILESTELEFFRKILVQQMDDLLRKGHSVCSDLREKESSCSDPLDVAAEISHQSCALQICDRDHQLLKKVTEALERIKVGEYGYCETCGEEIVMARLKARPVTRHCLDCKIILENQKKTIFYSS
jgi:DnaK suppressor protein